MGAKGITVRVRKFNEQRGSGQSRESWLRQHEGKHGNRGVIGFFDENGNETMTYLGEDSEGGVRVRKSEIADNVDTIVYLTNNDWTGPQMIKDMQTLVERSGARTLVYKNPDGGEYRLTIKDGSNRDAIAKELNKQARIWKKNNRATVLSKSKTMASWSKPLKSGAHKGEYKITIAKGINRYMKTKPTAAQLEKIWKQKIARQTTVSLSRSSNSETWKDLGFTLYRSK